MILVALLLMGLGSADLVRWSSDPDDGDARTYAAIAVAATVTLGTCALSGFNFGQVLVFGGGTAIATAGWVKLDHPTASPGVPLAFAGGLVLAALALSSLPPEVGGPAERWYEGLAIRDTGAVPLEQALTVLGAAVAALATGNRIVRLVLAAAGTPAGAAEDQLPGGRILGVLERLLLGALVLAGEPTGASIVIAAKSLIRLREIRTTPGERAREPDHVAEYFLIGTLTSLLLAFLLAGLVFLAA